MFANPFGALTLCFGIVRETPTLGTCNKLVQKVLVTVIYVLTGFGTRQLDLPFALVTARAGQILSTVSVSSSLLLKSVEPQFSGCRLYLLLTETSRFDLL